MNITSRTTWEEVQEEKRAKLVQTLAVYKTHMSKAAHYFYLAQTCVENDENGSAGRYHKLANDCVEAAKKAIAS